MKLNPTLLIAPLLAATVHGGAPLFTGELAKKTFMAPLQDKKSSRDNLLPRLRGLQPEPPDLPDPPGEGEPASYCDFLFLLFNAQANAYGFDCDCVSDEEKDTVSCNSRSLTCDKYSVGDVDMICHSDHFTSSVTKGSVSEEGYKVFDFVACSKYEDAPLAPGTSGKRSSILSFSSLIFSFFLSS